MNDVDKAIAAETKQQLIYKKRLLAVAEALRDASKTRSLKKLFTMGTWAHEPGLYEMVDRTGERVEIFVTKKECGTPACALGHYAARRDLQSFFRLNKAGDLSVKGDTDLSADSVYAYAADHFGLSAPDCETIFGGYGCDDAKTPFAAAKFIEKFVKQKYRHLGGSK